jgi:multidrug efflux system outer membrane protein
MQSQSRRNFAPKKLLIALPLALLVGGCAVGPNYRQPKPDVSAQFGNGSGFVTNDNAITWWRGFKDAELNLLVQRSLTNNLDLRIATANLREARALYRESQFDLLPTVNGTGSYVNERLSKTAVFGSPRAARHLELYDAGFDATYELDFFGHVRRSVEANAYALQAAVANRFDVRVSLISELARNYFELRGTQNELAVAQRNATNQNETLKITQARLDGGMGTELDVARANAQLNNTLATIPPLETLIAGSMHRLSVLCGLPPTALNPELKLFVPLPALPALINIGTPETLLRRRPDIRVAERRLAAATARIGIAVADLFPRVTFNGKLGLEASTLAGLGKTGADTWSFGPQITWAALDYGHVRARIRAADARAEASLGEYERTVLTALEETENALVAFGREQARRDRLHQAVQSSQRAAQLARIRFENGATDFLIVLDSERVLLEAQDQLAKSETQTATALVSVYKALGGGWESSADDTSRHTAKN